ncbi:lipopolysaccharide biosynthesis protein [Novosphingobium aquimarinum]|uniref:lipopolysaccharide biosynthesis protein n=1 Tax=Novosphingobium aquimarinum TaxID=2682494 RepID=UPI0012EB0905|nr:hypothetical protein [Novosphingobium aquimarinum]
MATLLQTFVYARELESVEFGTFSLVQGICLLAQGLQRSTSVLPMIMTAGSEGGDAVWGRVDLVFRVATAATLGLLALAAWIFDFPRLWQSAFPLAGFCTLATLAYEFQRRLLYLHGCNRAILQAALAYFLAVCVSVVVVVNSLRSAEAAAGGLLFAAALASMVAWQNRDFLSPKEVIFKDHIGIIGWNIAAFLPYSVYNNGMILIVGVIYGVKTVALFSASRLLIAPIQTLIQAIDSVDKPRARRMFLSGGMKGLSQSIRHTRVTLILIGGSYLAIIFVAVEKLVPLLFLDQFPDMINAVRIWCLVAFIMLLSQPLETGLLVLRKSDVIFWSRSLSAIAALVVLGLFATSSLHLIPIVALAVGWGFGGILAYVSLHRSFLRREA